MEKISLYLSTKISAINKIAGLKNFIKTRHQHRCFLVNIAKPLRTAFSVKQLRWLLLPFFIIIIIYLFKVDLIYNNFVYNKYTKK